MQNIRSVRGVRKEINYSEPCSNAADKAQLSLGCTHLNTRSLRSKKPRTKSPATNTAPTQPQTAEITPSPTIITPTTPPHFPESPPSKKPRTKSPATNTAPTQYFHVDIEEEFPLHEKYELQDVTSTNLKAIAKSTPDNVDLPVYFVYHRYNKHWTLIKGPTSKFCDVVWYEYIEQFYKRGTKHRNSAYWYNTLEKSCSDPLGGGRGPLLLRLVSPSILGMTYSK